MKVDLSQFHQAFFEESFEGLDVMESALMSLDPDNIDKEAIDTIFRAAHSLKGGGATFGFTSISGFTHVLETLLDQIRSGLRSMRSSDVDLFLQSVDCMREILSLNREGETGFTETATTLKQRFEAVLANQPDSTPNGASNPQGAPSPSGAETSSKKKVAKVGQSSKNVSSELNASIQAAADSSKEKILSQHWSIRFIPGPDILKSGNDPIRIFSGLADLGVCTAVPILDQLPTLHDLEPERLNLGWQIELIGECDESAIREQFDWVIDECDLHISSQSEPVLPEWKIRFVPDSGVLHSGNEPLKILQELKNLSTHYEVTPIMAALPSLKVLDPEICYLGWNIRVRGHTNAAAIQDVFAWVADESDICIEACAFEKDLDINGESVAETDLRSPTVIESSVETPLKPSTNVVPMVMAQSPTEKSPTEKSPTEKSPSSAATTKSSESTSIRVGIDKIDNLINMVGELVITQSMLGQLGTDFDQSKIANLIEGLNQLEQNTRELQESVMRIRMLPISFAFSRFPRMVRDLGQQLSKKIHLEMLGENTELDKTVMEKIGDPLVHLVRNAVDHGIEPPAARAAAGKSEEGLITLNAYHQGGNVVIEISDDGKGLDAQVILKKAIDKGLVTELESHSFTEEQIFDLIFEPGFSTADIVSDVSGRGVGMDVVRRNIQALNGVVEIRSRKGFGSKISIRLPLTLAILDGQLVRVGDQIYIFPLVSIVESLQCRKDQINHIAGGASVFKLRDDYVPIVALDSVFEIVSDSASVEKLLMVVIEADGEKVGIVVDELLAQQQVVIKSLEQNYRRIDGVSGATILGDGTVALILDLPGVVKLSRIDKVNQASHLSALIGASKNFDLRAHA